MAETASTRRQIVRYVAFKVRPEWRALPDSVRLEGKQAFAAVIEGARERQPVLRTYSTVGMRADSELLLWSVTWTLEDQRDLQASLLATPLGPYLDVAHSFLAMTKRSMYVDERHQHEGQEGTRSVLRPRDTKYLFVYPFVKTRAWYALSRPERQKMMDQHIAFGHTYPSVTINTSYSFGLDDQEFVVAFETDSEADFLDLVMDLRATAASSYTLRDTPILTGIAMPCGDALDTLG
jgi:chlorite dismutase